jgi:hypothetical protein
MGEAHRPWQTSGERDSILNGRARVRWCWWFQVADALPAPRALMRFPRPVR